jgi:hypothetical protein
MGQALQGVRNEPEHTVEIVVHVSEDLQDAQRKDLVNALQRDGGIVSAEFCPLRYHLILVRYDRDYYNSQDVLGRVREQKLHARLIGPV